MPLSQSGPKTSTVSYELLVLHDRSDLKVGPISIEILDPLKSLRVRCEANEWGIDLDVTWTASHHPLEEPRQYLRREGR